MTSVHQHGNRLVISKQCRASPQRHHEPFVKYSFSVADVAGGAFDDHNVFCSVKLAE